MKMVVAWPRFPVLERSAYAKKPGPSSIAIVGGGVAGLTAAYRVQQHGAKPVLFEASNRWVGRMFTQYDFYKGMFCELGGEFVDTAHEDPAPSNDTFYSDLGFQTLWETSGVQPGGAGIITDYLGSKPGINDAKSALDAFRTDIPKMSPKMAESLDPNAVTAWFWIVYPFMLGSHASAKTGQYTTLLELAAEPALRGRLQFAGIPVPTPRLHE